MRGAGVSANHVPSVREILLASSKRWSQAAHGWRALSKAALEANDLQSSLYAGNEAALRDEWAEEDAALANKLEEAP